MKKVISLLFAATLFTVSFSAAMACDGAKSKKSANLMEEIKKGSSADSKKSAKQTEKSQDKKVAQSEK